MGTKSRSAKPTRPTGLGDDLSMYFRDLAKHDVLTPEREREIARALEEAEVATWAKLLSRPAVARRLADRVALPQPLLDVIHAYADGPLPRDPAAPARLRALDMDHVHIDTVVRELRSGKAQKAVIDIHRRAQALRDEFVRANLRLVVKMARRYDRGALPLADLIQEGNLGLVHAVPRFDYRRGLRFSTYACWWIRHAVSRAVSDKAHVVRVPVHIHESQYQIERARQRLVGELGRQPEPDEIAAAAKMSLEHLETVARYAPGFPVSTSDVRDNEDGDDYRPGDALLQSEDDREATEEAIYSAEVREQLRGLLDRLSPLERDVISERFGLDGDDSPAPTLRQVGDRHNLSRERIRQIQAQAIGKLRRAMVQKDDD